MPHTDLAQQTELEKGMLSQIMEMLRTTMAWQTRSDDGSRKLSTLRFMAQSFQRHLGRMMALEEYDGYMDLVMETSPNLSRAVEALRQDHDRFRQAASHIVLSLERLSILDHDRFEAICEELRTLLQKLDEHHKKEATIWHEALDRDGGGEG